MAESNDPSSENPEEPKTEEPKTEKPKSIAAPTDSPEGETVATPAGENVGNLGMGVPRMSTILT